MMSKCLFDFFHVFRRYSQVAAPVILEAGKKYYIEGVGYENGNVDHFAIGAYLPDGTALLPITSHYLSEHRN